MSLHWKLLFGLWPCVAVGIGLWRWDSAFAAILLYHAGIAVGVGCDTKVLGLIKRGFRWFPAIGGIVIGILTIPVVLLCLPILVGMESPELGEVLSSKLAETGLSGSWFWLFLAYFVTIHPILEELGWRAILQSDSAKPHGLDLEFAIYHLLVLGYFFPKAWPLLVVTFLVLSGSAWLWRQMRRSMGGLASVILFHAAADAGILIAVWMLVR
tara:strand:+ start:48475 stop:49110 length:636 start_codon:yes stop_codon:yes gene_type:complete